MTTVDLNVDLGELPGEPAELYSLATAVNVACGGHAGDQASMARALSFAMARGTRVAAHPSYPDREGFGRKTLAISPTDLAASVETQCAALQAIARRLGYPVAAVKPHGALYHDAAKDGAVARAVLDGAAHGLGVHPKELGVVGPPRGALLEAALQRGCVYLREGFADRGYNADHSLIPRGQPGAVLGDPDACARQALALVRAGGLETLCIHGDNKDALAIATLVRAALVQAGALNGVS